jgi:hypothetical protein
VFGFVGCMAGKGKRKDIVLWIFGWREVCPLFFCSMKYPLGSLIRNSWKSGEHNLKILDKINSIIDSTIYTASSLSQGEKKKLITLSLSLSICGKLGKKSSGTVLPKSLYFIYDWGLNLHPPHHSPGTPTLRK